MRDYLILHRQILHWEWHDDAYMVSLFIHLLCMANYLPNYKYRGQVQRVGELQTSIPQLSALTGISQNTIISKLRKLQNSGEIIVNPTKKGTNIYIRNYAKYQGIECDTTATIAELGGVIDGVQLGVQYGATGGAQLAEQNGAQIGVQHKNGTKTAKNHASSPACSASCSATIAEQVADNQLNNNNNNINNINNNTNTHKQESEAQNCTVLQPAKPQYTTSQLTQLFDEFRRAYKGTKRGLQVEFDNLKNKNANWREIVPILMQALEREIVWREQMQEARQFVPQWAHLQTWINQKRWETEFETIETAMAANAQANQQATAQQQPPKDEEYGGSFGGMDY